MKSDFTQHGVVSPNPTQSFESWIADQLPDATAEERTYSADPDADNISNLQEFSLGTDPGNPSSNTTIEVVRVDGKIYAQFLQRRGVPGLSYAVEAGESLQQWTELPDLTEIVPNPTTAPPQYFDLVRQELKSQTEGYARLRIVLQSAE